MLDPLTATEPARLVCSLSARVIRPTVRFCCRSGDYQLSAGAVGAGRPRVIDSETGRAVAPSPRSTSPAVIGFMAVV